MNVLEATLPWPPSVNHYWRQTGGRFYIAQAGKNFRTAVAYTVGTRRLAYKDRLAVHLTAYPPDRRRRDLDNVLKATLDALQHAGVYEDDNQIDRLVIVRKEPAPGRGRIFALITPFI